jgi:membrane dipeptidase
MVTPPEIDEANQNMTDESARSPIPVFDGHNDTLLRLVRSGRADAPRRFLDGDGEGHLDLPRARAGGFAGGLFAVWTPSAKLGPDLKDASEVDRATALEATIAMISMLARIERASAGAVRVARSVAEIRAAWAAGALAPVVHVEGAEVIDPDLKTLDLLYAAGLRSLGPVWSRPGPWGGGVPFRFPSSPDIGPGLTDAGRALVRACDELGILVDCSHLTEKGFWDVAAISDRPLVASHSNVHAICAQSRNLTDRQLDAIAERKGLVGVNFGASFLHPEGKKAIDMPIDGVLAHVDHLVEKLGIDGVALGSDYDGTSVPTVLSDASKLQAIPEALAARGWSRADLDRLCHGNWLRILETVWGA